ncbi:hypothetical protein LZ24_03427 [Desulfobotulus alkaliphilus]|uniref:Uncharacterized protein n=1 Tax=Desulfobotulus alkaliphilus TaxID=622671 RepID=A0A562QXP4_9BACT|nr:hypothetical protein [Desulfobotulus alkaliphilus]TWI61611.1 hypothetical protein LZ24_03427 [Desulfobotulus alkaliphilus]
MAIAQEYFGHWETNYKPMEIDQINANRSMIPYETAQHKAQLGLGTAQANAQLGLLPQQTAFASSQMGLGQAQHAAQMELLPQQTDLARAQMGLGMTQAQAGQQKTMMGLGATQSLYNDVMAGPDLKGASDVAGSQMAAGFQGAAQKTAADASRMGMGNMLGGLGASNIGMGASVAAAKNQARRDEKNAHTQKLGMMTGLGG